MCRRRFLLPADHGAVMAAFHAQALDRQLDGFEQIGAERALCLRCMATQTVAATSVFTERPKTAANGKHASHVTAPMIRNRHLVRVPRADENRSDGKDKKNPGGSRVRPRIIAAMSEGSG